MGIVSRAQEVPSLKNVSILLANAQNIALGGAEEVTAHLKDMDDSKAYSLIVVGKITEDPAGSSPYQLKEFGSEEGVLLTNATFSRDESLRMLTDCLALESGAKKALVFSEVHNVNQTESKLIRGLREGGYSRPQELEHMITKGPEEYEKACAEYGTREPAQTPFDEWVLEQERIENENKAERSEQAAAEAEEKKKKEIEEIATEWAKREYFRQSMAGEMPYTEEEYRKSVWERALFEGDLKYRMMRGQETDERKELADFKSQQERKKEVMLERAKASLQELLDDDDIDDDDE